MSYTVDDKLKKGISFPFTHLPSVIGLCSNFFMESGHYELKHDLNMSDFGVKHQNSSLTNVPIVNSFINRLGSRVHHQIVSIPPKTLFKCIPHFALKDFISLDEKPLNYQEKSHLKLREIFMLFLPSQNDLKESLARHQSLISDKEYFKPNNIGGCSICIEQDLFTSLTKETNEDENKFKSTEFDEIDIIFQNRMGLQDSCDDRVDESDEEFYEHKNVCYDSSDGENDGKDFGGDEVDERYSLSTTVNQSSTLVFTGVDQIMVKWDPGVEELRNLPKALKNSYEFSLDSSDEDDKLLIEANQKWNDCYNLCCKRKRKSSKKVRFANDDMLLTVYCWDDVEGSRNGPWQQYALDSARFKRRIDECEKLLDRILQPEHRSKIFSTNLK